MSLLEVIAVLFNALGVFLTAKRIRWCWPIGAIAVLLYAWLFYQYKLYSDMLLQLIFAIIQGYGWWHWKKDNILFKKISIVPLAFRTALNNLALGSIGVLLLGALMHYYTDAALPWLDSALTIFSLIASIWGARKHIISWRLWIILDTLYTGIFIYKGLYLTAILYIIFIGLAIYGLYSWKHSTNASN